MKLNMTIHFGVGFDFFFFLNKRSLNLPAQKNSFNDIVKERDCFHYNTIVAPAFFSVTIAILTL